MVSNKWRRCDVEERLNLAVSIKRIGVDVDRDVSQLEFFNGVFDGKLQEEVR
jgi:hypothetical protein